ncbi:MAG TPA: MBL fold metallo-hydrolase [Solirubrobacteraceae bacterium]|nr:MBL fold metallo-hydrolase [Solirubrobacteraceae bacterium]
MRAVSILDPARYIAEFARFAATKSSQERHDQQALAELERRAIALPSGLELTWLGVSGYRFDYEGHTLLIDPYVSRVPLGALIRRTPALPDARLIDRYIGTPQCVGVLVGHTHFDHAVDAPAIAKRLGCPAYGSGSLARLLRLHGAGEFAVEVVPYERYELGPFTVSFTPSAHSKLLLGLAVPFDGALTCDHLDGLAPAAYRCGDVFGIHVEVAGVTFYHQGSANLIDDAITHRGVDFFLAGVAGRGFTASYWKRILRLLAPQTVIPTHYDDFFRPLSGEMGFTTNVNLAHVPDEVHAVSRDITVAALPLLGDRRR